MLKRLLCHSEPRGRRISRRLSNKGKSQHGFTLVELIIVIALIGIIAAAATMAIHQVLTGTTLSNDLNTAVNQVRNAGYWISRDTQMAQDVEDNPGDPKILELTWEDWEGSPHTVYYTLQHGKLERNHDGYQQALIAQDIKPKGEGTDCHWDEVERMLTVTITAQVGDKSETRTFQVKPRPDVTS